MAIKLCLDNEIHRMTKTPETFQDILDLVKTVFGSQVSNGFALSYIDADGDKIALTSDEDFQCMMETELNDSKKSLKVYVQKTNSSAEAQEEKKVEEPIKIPKKDEQEKKAPVVDVK